MYVCMYVCTHLCIFIYIYTPVSYIVHMPFLHPPGGNKKWCTTVPSQSIGFLTSGGQSWTVTWRKNSRCVADFRRWTSEMFPSICSGDDDSCGDVTIALHEFVQTYEESELADVHGCSQGWSEALCSVYKSRGIYRTGYQFWVITWG